MSTSEISIGGQTNVTAGANL